jgi:hypothetical protein
VARNGRLAAIVASIGMVHSLAAFELQGERNGVGEVAEVSLSASGIRQR